MKISISFRAASAAGLAIVLSLYLASCEKSPTVIDPDKDDFQTLIIKKGKNNPFSREAFEAKLTDEDYYAFMWIGHNKGEQSFLPLPDTTGHTWGGTYNDVLVQMWSVKDRNDFAFADLGTVNLGETTIPVWRGGGVVKYEIGGELRELTHYYQLIIDADDQAPLFTGKTPFTISSSPDVQDVATDLDLPDRNLVLNVHKGVVVDPDKDWIIELKYPLEPDTEGLVLHERSDRYITNDWQDRFDGVSHLIIQVTAATNVLRIPSQDLQELKRNSSVNLFTLALHPEPRVIARVPLDRHDGSLNETLTIVSIQYHFVEFSFQQ
jgi:hypothetical protein